MKEPGLIFSIDDQADEFNKKFIIWLLLNKQNILIRYVTCVWRDRVSCHALLYAKSTKKCQFAANSCIKTNNLDI